MIKRTIYFENPAYLSLRNHQMVIKLPSNGDGKEGAVRTMAIEDLGFVIIDCSQVTLTSALIDALTANNTALITCDSRHIPTSMTLPLDSHSLQSARFQSQLSCSLPLKKQLWRQTIMAKISNQASALEIATKTEVGNMRAWATQVCSNDSKNLEARAAVYYWRTLLPDRIDFNRDRFGEYPNNFFNYAYAILRGVVARALVGRGLLPILGIHHHNRYNAYCLADDVMEPYRPIIDLHVLSTIEKFSNQEIELTTKVKQELLRIPVLDVNIGGHKSPLMIAAEETATSLLRCFEGTVRHIIYPTL